MTRFRPASANPWIACERSECPATVHSGLNGAADRRRLPSPAASRIAVEIMSLIENEFFDGVLSKVVGHLLGRVLAEISGGRIDRPALAAIEREFRAADHVDRDAGAVRRIFD